MINYCDDGWYGTLLWINAMPVRRYCETHASYYVEDPIRCGCPQCNEEAYARYQAQKLIEKLLRTGGQDSNEDSVSPV